jgi:hypothetical protein
MNKQSKARWLTLAAAAALAAASAGCQNGASGRLHGERFEEDNAPHAFRNIAAVQASVGARADATLYPSHFNAAGLNSLGRDKLDRMLLDEEAAPPLVVYLDLPKGDDVGQARTAVSNYLKARGVADGEYKVEDGANPKTLHRADEAVAGLDALKSTATGASNQAGQPAGNTTGYSSGGGAAPAPANR